MIGNQQTQQLLDFSALFLGIANQRKISSVQQCYKTTHPVNV